ncbi:MAG: hypothetical protein RQ763_00140 [Sulfurimonas sp.]|uniref:hypothetical protein n=1 Tax=Sulfurimonas sp. TaxID=2022749 RepID=UPI0028CCAE6C|nr:hypothetical protein [Sulfurimonas sp.]MDT8337582.1 hypothetical protein [Sulfurimonas sp.]
MSIIAMRIYALLIVAAALAGVGYKCYAHMESLKDEISSRDVSISQLERKMEDAQKKMLTTQLESERYQAALLEQSRTIELHGEKYKQSQKELTKWRADAKKYQNIERHLPSQTIIYRSNCEDIKTYFDSLDGFSLDSMQ